jgi:hypothetical protein
MKTNLAAHPASIRQMLEYAAPLQTACTDAQFR